MTVYPAPSQVMHTEVDVTMSSVQVHATSSKPASGLEHTGSACDSHASSAGANATLSTSAQGVPASAAASGDGEKEGQDVADVSEAALPSPRTVVSLTDVVATDKAANSGGPAAMPAASNSTVEDCSKLVQQMCRELSLLHWLSHGVGVETDSAKLREEVLQGCHRACSLAQHCKTALLPLLRGKSKLTAGGGSEVDRQYRLYSGCLDYLLPLLWKVRSLLAVFCLHQGVTEESFIKSGIANLLETAHRTSSHPHTRQSASSSHANTGGSSVSPTPADLLGEIQAMQQLVEVVNSACDLPPWEVGEEEQDGPSSRRLSSNRLSKKETRRSGGRHSKANDPGRDSKDTLETTVDTVRPEMEVLLTARQRRTASSRGRSKARGKSCCCWSRLLCGTWDDDDCPPDQVPVIGGEPSSEVTD